ncbi:MAG: D-alanine--D-alanine ligase [Blastocatellia bacterium]
MSKLRIGVIFGGRSGEHEVSLRSAHSIIQALDKNKYEAIPIGITKLGNWLTANTALGLIPEAIMSNPQTESVALVGAPTYSGLVKLNGVNLAVGEKLDVIFPALHGTYGEDGTIQGLFELADIPYVGCGVLASSTGMDKVAMKNLFVANDLAVGKFSWFLRKNWEQNRQAILDKLETDLNFPMFVKPANLGSSVGISKAKNLSQLEQAIDLAIKYDRKIIVEAAVNAREFEISVLGNDSPIASLPGEVIPGAEFYDYNDKYIDNKTQFEIPAKLSQELVEGMQQLAIKAFQAIDGSGLARVDFFLDRDTNELLLNEINTMPGFTSISMYPKLWEASGLSYSTLIDRLIELAIERHKEKSQIITTYDPNS